MNIFVRPFKASDFTEFVPIEPLQKTDIGDPEFAQAIEDSGLAVTGIYGKDRKVIGCAGVHPIDEFHGEIWLRLSPECMKHKISTLRWLKAGLKIVEETYPFKQLNATIQECFEVSSRMIEYLGFVSTEMKEIDGKQWVTYSKRIKDGQYFIKA